MVLLAAGVALGASLGCGPAGVAGPPAPPVGERALPEERGALVPHPGFTAVAPLEPGERHAYSLELPAGELTALTVRQHGVDAVLEVRGPGDQVLTTADSPTGTAGRERTLVVSRGAGIHRVIVVGIGVSTGGYALRLDALRRASEADRGLAAAVAALDRAELLRLNGPESGCHDAEPAYREALDGLVNHGSDLEWEARALHGLGTCLAEIGDPEEAAALLDEAAVRFGEAGLFRSRAWALRELGIVLHRVSEPRRARHALDRSVALFREIGDPAGEAAALLARGELAAATSEFEEALADFERSLNLARRAGSTGAEATALSELGQLYTLIGYTDEALDHLRAALALQRAPAHDAGRIDTVTAIGWAHYLDLDPADSLPYYAEALALARKQGDPASEAGVLDRLGSACRKLGLYDESERAYRASAELARRLNRPVAESSTLANLGRLMIVRGESAAAVPLLDESIRRLHAAGDRNGALSPQLDRARADRLLGDPDAALARLEPLVGELGALRGGLRGESHRALFLATRHELVEEAIDLLFELYEQRREERYLLRALEVSEQARALGLLEGLAGTGLGLQVADPEAAARYRDLARRLSTADLERAALLRGDAGPERLAAADSRVRTLALAAERALAELRPAVAELAPKPLSADAIRGLAEPDTTLLVYALAERRSFLWVIRPEGVEGYALRGRAAIDALARAAVTALEASGERILRGQAQIAATALAEAVLAPAAEHLGRGRLVVIPDGALHAVPFAALPRPAPGRRPLAERPLIADHEIVVLPSASVLALQRRFLASRPPARRTLAVIADPVFRADDPRLAGALTAGSPAVSPSQPSQPFDGHLSRAARDLDLTSLKRLRHSRDEAAALAAMVPEADRLVALDFDASRETVTSGRLGEFQIVHIAGHGLLNTVHPSLSGVVLSLYDEQGRPRNGFVRAHELRELDLSADLVVLSACRTGLGREIAGEGVLGVTRGLLLAGARRVVVSHWDVDDEATAELMVRFYTGMRRDGLTPAAALRAAELSMLGDAAWSAPAHWAAFSLHGDWR